MKYYFLPNFRGVMPKGKKQKQKNKNHKKQKIKNKNKTKTKAPTPPNDYKVWSFFRKYA